VKFIAGTNQNFWSAKLVGHDKKIVREVIAVVICPHYRSKSNANHGISARDRLAPSFQSWFGNRKQDKTN
jgi:hypothetical protein